MRIFLILILLFMLCGCSYQNSLISQTSPPKTTQVTSNPKTSIIHPSPKPTNGTAPTSAIKPKNLPVRKPLTGITICVDAGHGKSSYNKQEKIAPTSNETKLAFVGGTSGKTFSEEQINLKVALLLEQKLNVLGARVIMTRKTAACDRSNIDRAKLANKNNVDVTIRLHCDGSGDNSVNGISMLIPGTKYVSQKIVKTSSNIGNLVLKEVIAATRAKSRGIVQRNDLTGFNWSTVPVILIEMGFMSNPVEDKQLSSTAYQEELTKGITTGLIMYFSLSSR